MSGRSKSLLRSQPVDCITVKVFTTRESLEPVNFVLKPNCWKSDCTFELKFVNRGGREQRSEIVEKCEQEIDYSSTCNFISIKA